MAARTLIKGGCVLTLGQRTQNYDVADVLIEDDHVIEIGRDLRSRGADLVDAEGTIVMPGFIDTHRHAWRSLFRNQGGTSGPEDDSSSDHSDHHNPDDIYAATLIGLLGAIEAGITTIVDWSDSPTGQEFTEAAFQAHADSGARTVFVQPASVSEGDSVARPSPPPAGLPSNTLATVGFGSADPSGMSLDEIQESWSTARAAGLRIHAHIGTDTSEAGLAAALGENGLLGEDVTLVHCSHLGIADLDAISSSGAKVALTPSTEMAGGLGAPPIQMLIDRGIRPGLGVDDERFAPGDIFAQMRATNAIQHATMFDLKLAGKAGLPTLLTTREVIRYATVDGANAIGLASMIGSIEVGKQADIIVLRADRPNIAPVNDPIGAVVWGMDTSNLDWVFIGGIARMANGHLVADVANAAGLANAARDRVASSVGIAAWAGGQP